MKQLNDNKLNIKCEWMETKRLLINPDGQVLPCCYLANVVYMYDLMNKIDAPEDDSKYLLDADESVETRVKRRNDFQNKISEQIGDKERIIKETKQDNVLMNYYQNKDKYNIHKTPLEEIINSEWFTKTLPESWDNSDVAVRQCKKHCTKKNEK